MGESDVEREHIGIVRQHQCYLLKELRFTQQFAGMYSARLRALLPRAEAQAADSNKGLSVARVLDLVPFERAIGGGTLYKNVKPFAGFLAEYQKELLRLDAGDAEDDAEDLDAIPFDDVNLGKERSVHPQDSGHDETLDEVGEQDVLFLEDVSGRVELEGLDPRHYATGMVVSVVGCLTSAGILKVERLYESCAIPRLPFQTKSMEESGPRYIAFVSGLRVGHTAVAALELLLAYLMGNTGVERLTEQARRITRLVIGGDLIDSTEDLKLRYKVRLETADHVRSTATAPSASAMQQADRLLRKMCESVEVELMPGESDPANTFFPQQPLHPVLLPLASQCSSLRLVTNPYEFDIPQEQHDGDRAIDVEQSDCDSDSPNQITGDTCNSPALRFLVSSGQNVTDLQRQLHDGGRCSSIDAMLRMVAVGHQCPTAPNTLLSYPFEDQDPFVLLYRPHCMIACNQPSFSTRYHEGVRYIAVKQFLQSHEMVLVNVESPSLEVETVLFGALP